MVPMGGGVTPFLVLPSGPTYFSRCISGVFGGGAEQGLEMRKASLPIMKREASWVNENSFELDKPEFVCWF